MLFHENRLLALNFIPYFCRKLEKVSQNLSSAAVVIGALRVYQIAAFILTCILQIFLSGQSRLIYLFKNWLEANTINRKDLCLCCS